jgi:hypothetical protein
LNLDGLPSASCIPDIQIDLLIYIGGKLAGLSDWKPISFGGGLNLLNVSCKLVAGATALNTQREATIFAVYFQPMEPRFLYGVVSNMDVLRAREAYIVCNSRLEPTARVVG